MVRYRSPSGQGRVPEFLWVSQLLVVSLGLPAGFPTSWPYFGALLSFIRALLSPIRALLSRIRALLSLIRALFWGPIKPY